MSDKAKTNPDALCPSCERYIGAVTTCPYCGCESTRAPMIRHLRLASWLLALLGLTCLLLAARGVRCPTVAIADIDPMMNFGFVRIDGTVTRDPYISRPDSDDPYLSFSLDDGTGRARVFAQGDCAHALLGGCLEKGTRVCARGTLSISADRGVRLRLLRADHLEFQGPQRETAAP